MGDTKNNTSVVNCCVPLCKSTSENSRTVSFYKFPENENRKTEWTQVLMDMKMFGTIVKEKGSDSVSEWHICSRHFTSEDFEKGQDRTGQLRKSSSSNQELLVKRSLCYDAVPSVFAVSYMREKKKVGGSNKKVVIIKRKRVTTDAGTSNQNKIKDRVDEKPVRRAAINSKNVKIVVTKSLPVVVQRSTATPQVTIPTPPPQNTSEISAKMENIVNKMELTLKSKSKPLPSLRKPIPGVPVGSMEDAVMSWLCLPQNIHAPFKPEPFTKPKATPSNKVSNKQQERRSPRAAVVVTQSPRAPPNTSLESVCKLLVESKSPPVIVPGPPPKGKHRPPKISLTNATKKPSKQNIQNAEPERKQPGTVQSMLSDAITKVFSNPCSSKNKPKKLKQPSKLMYTEKQIRTVDGLLDDMPLANFMTQTKKANSRKSSSNIKSQQKEKRQKTNVNDSDLSDSDGSDNNVEYVNGQVPWEAYDSDNMDSVEDEVPDENVIDYDSYSNSLRLPVNVSEIVDVNGRTGIQDPLAILKYEVVEETDADDVNDPSSEYSTPLLNGFAFGMSEEDCILSAPAASSAVTAVPESANSRDDIIADPSKVKVEAVVKMEYLSDDENVDSCAIVPETQIDGNNPEYSPAVADGAIPDVQVKTEPLDPIIS